MDAIKCAVRNITRKWRRSLLTLVGIAIGVASVVVISTIGEFGKTSVTTELESLGLGGVMVSTTDKGASATLRQEEVEIIKQTPNVKYAMPIMMLYSSAEAKNTSSDALILGVDAGAGNMISLNILYGRSFLESDVASREKVCLIDQSLALEGYNRENVVGKKISLLLNGVREEYRVVGVTKTGSGLLQGAMGSYIPSIVYVPYTALQKSVGQTTFQQVAVRIADHSNADAVSRSIVQTLERRTGSVGKYTADNLSKQRDGLNSLLDTVTLALTAIGAISMLVASLSIMTMMLVSVNERTREIGIKKSIGASRAKIMTEFLIEAIVLSLFGSVVGVLLGILVTVAASLWLGISISLRFDMILYTALFAVVTGVIFGVYPAVKASGMKPVDALRCE